MGKFLILQYLPHWPTAPAIIGAETSKRLADWFPTDHPAESLNADQDSNILA
jgi:hypothetical protein